MEYGEGKHSTHFTLTPAAFFLTFGQLQFSEEIHLQSNLPLFFHCLSLKALFISLFKITSFIKCAVYSGFGRTSYGRRNLKTLERKKRMKDFGNISLDSCAV